MAKKSAVVNTSDREYVEKFHDKEYRVPARGELVLSRHEAIEFVGAYAGDNVVKPLKIRHLENGETEVGFVCNLCGKAFPSAKALESHVEKDHADSSAKKVLVCPFCSQKVGNRNELYAHMRSAHKDKKMEDVLSALEKVG